MKITAKITEIERATNRLKGILAGIAIDKKINDYEITNLYNWMNENEFLDGKEPFSSTLIMLREILQDGIITESEREELLEWCEIYRKGTCEIPDQSECTTAVRKLHGVIHGIALDEKVTDIEISGLQTWMKNYRIFKNTWPFCDFFSFVEQILEDSIVSEKERKEFQSFCNQFVETIIPDAIIHDHDHLKGWMQTHSQIFRPFTAYCDNNASVIFTKHSFCFTGPAKYGARTSLEKMVFELGGIPQKGVSTTLDYLVIGAQSSPCWAYSTYGRKIEKAIALQQKGNPIVILHENRFIEQAGYKGSKH